MDWERIKNNPPLRIAAAVVGITLVVTASLVGIVGLFTVGASGLRDRFPFYVFATAIAFVITLWKLDDEDVDGGTVLIATSGIALFVGIMFSLAVEGVRFGIAYPGEIVASHLLVYFLAASLFCTGLGMWVLRHWREFTTDLEDEDDE